MASSLDVVESVQESAATLDHFAEVFVPAWLKGVNLDRAVVLHQERPAFDYLHYPTIFNQTLLEEMDREERKCYKYIDDKLGDLERLNRQKARPVVPNRGIQILNRDGSASQSSLLPPPTQSQSTHLSPMHQLILSPDNYAQHFLQLLYKEYESRSSDLKRANLYSVKLTPVDPNSNDPALSNLYSVEARSIREGSPAVDLGDVVELRQLRPWSNSWQGWAFKGTVYSINRSAGRVTLRIDFLKTRIESLLFNVLWHAQDRIFYSSRRAIEACQLQLTPSIIAAATPSSLRSRMERWLFPIHADLDQVVQEERPITWVDNSLNKEQRNAVRSILFGQTSIPFLLNGPPGTGKTKTLVEAVLQILVLHPQTSILVCGASNPSSDTLALRLLKHLSPDVLFRLNDASRPFSEMKVELLAYSCVEAERFSLPPIAELLKKRVIVCSCADSALLSLARVTNLSLTRLESNVLSTLHPSSKSPLLAPHFGFLLVDEAAQAMEAELIIPISIVITNPALSLPSHLTICGDSMQLGPMIVSAECRAQGLDNSLLDRLLDTPVYRSGMMSANRNQWNLNACFVNLRRNYRSATPILMIPSTLFYSDSLIPSASPLIQNSPLHAYARLTARFPLLFINVDGIDEPVDESVSFWNEAEVHRIRDLVVELVNKDGTPRHGPLRASEISIISPFREQVWRIRLALRRVGMGDVDGGNVEALQGAENRVVIISTVRSRSQRHFRADRLQHRGLIFESKRFNVAVTRAKELLIVVGNAETLLVDPLWQNFIKLTLRNKSFAGPNLSSAVTHLISGADVISRLEVEDRAKRRREGLIVESTTREDRDHEFEILVGSVAREALWEAR